MAERLGERMDRRIDAIEESASLIDFAFNSSFLTLLALCVIDPRAPTVGPW